MSQFDDIWGFLPVDDDAEPAIDLSPEEAAMHIDVPVEWGRAFDDPARRDVAMADQDRVVLTVADDEDDGLVHRVAEHEPDVEEVLERRHLALGRSVEEQ